MGRGKLLRYLGAAILLLWLGAACLLAAHWPFSKAKLITTLQNRSGRTVTIDLYRKTYFPPGGIAEGVHFLRHDSQNKPPVISLQKLEMKGSWPLILSFRQKLPEVDVYGLHLLILPKGPDADGQPIPAVPLNSASKNKSTEISEFLVHGAALDFVSSQSGREPFHLAIRDLKLSTVGVNKPFRFEAVVENPIPKGEIRAKGSFGPWSPTDPGRTPVEGTFEYSNVQLNTVPGIFGILQSQGKFSGPLSSLEVDGNAKVPDFRVAHSTHTESLAVEYHAKVDGTNGDTYLNDVHASFGHTTVKAAGSVVNQEGQLGWLADLHASVANGRVEDLLQMFIASKASPLFGSVSLTTTVRFPSGPRKFLERLEMSGDFSSGGDRFKNPSTQNAVNRLTESARGEQKQQQDVDPATVLSQLRGHVNLKGGVAHIRNLTLHAPETYARMDGTLNLITQDVNLAGTLQTEGKLSDTQNGFKSFAAKMITPFLKKHNTTVAPFEIKGKYGSVSTRLDLDGARKL